MTEFEQAVLNGERWALLEVAFDQLEAEGWIPKASSSKEISSKSPVIVEDDDEEEILPF